jgi:hypothetical protein
MNEQLVLGKPDIAVRRRLMAEKYGKRLADVLMSKSIITFYTKTGELSDGVNDNIRRQVKESLVPLTGEESEMVEYYREGGKELLDREFKNDPRFHELLALEIIYPFHTINFSWESSVRVGSLTQGAQQLEATIIAPKSLEEVLNFRQSVFILERSIVNPRDSDNGNDTDLPMIQVPGIMAVLAIAKYMDKTPGSNRSTGMYL